METNGKIGGKNIALHKKKCLCNEVLILLPNYELIRKGGESETYYVIVRELIIVIIASSFK